MSEPATETRTAPPPRAGGKKYAGLTRTQWYVTGGVFAAVLGYLLWKRRQAASAAAAGTGGTVNQGSNECTDANGNPVDCNQAFASELAGLQNSLDQLGAQSGGGGSAGGYGGGTGTVGTIPPDTMGTGATAVTQPAATPVTSTGSTATATKTAAKTAGAISGLAASNVTKTSFKASWKAAANATGYAWAVRDLASHTQVKSGSTNATSVTVSGLKSGIDYNFGVQGLPGGAGNNIHVRTTG
jgi:hypothetical protein